MVPDRNRHQTDTKRVIFTPKSDTKRARAFTTQGKAKQAQAGYDPAGAADLTP